MAPTVAVDRSPARTAGNADPRDLEDGETAFEGDVESDATPEGGVDPQQRGRSDTEQRPKGLRAAMHS